MMKFRRVVSGGGVLLVVVILILCRWLSHVWPSQQNMANHLWHFTGETNCRNNRSTTYLNHLCRDYLNGAVGGSLCEPLCVTKEVEFVRCLGHGVKMHVLKAQWAANTIILKTTEPVSNYSLVAQHLQWYRDHNRLISKDEFVHQANQHLASFVGGRGVGKTVETAERVFSECDVLGDGQLSYSEAVLCWSLLETDEFVLLSLLRGVSAVPDLYGACGNMFASQFATSQPFLQGQLNLLDNRSWTFRARLAIALIEMAASLETTPYGTLYLCDVKGQNFGVVRQPGNNWLTAKTIDLDLSYFKSSSYRFAMHRPKCNSDNDCTYVDCHISCIKGTCSGAIISNNFQVLCANLLSPGWLQVSLLHTPPASVEGELRTVLDQCSLYTSLPQPHINTTIMNTLLSLLQLSLLNSFQ